MRASEAREIANIPVTRKKIFNLIHTEALNGQPGVWVNRFPTLLECELKKLGYELTLGGGPHQHKVWIYWGT